MKRTAWLYGLTAILILTGCSTSKNSKEEQEVQKEGNVKYEVKLPQRLSSFQFAINGNIYELPMRMEDVNELGWEFDGDNNKTVEPDSFLEAEQLKNDVDTIGIDLVNLELNIQPVMQCYVGGVTLEVPKDSMMQIELPNHIVVGNATLDDVLKSYGEPTDQYEEDDYTFFTYEYGIYKNVILLFDAEDEILQKAVLKNYRALEAESDISKSVPESVKNYTAPDSVSDNIRDVTAQYGGSYYRIPAPVSEFIKNDWKISKEGSDGSIKSGRHGYVTLEKDGVSLYAVAVNYSDVTTIIENCFLTGIHGDFDLTKVPIQIFKGISLGMEERDMVELLEGITYEEKENDQLKDYIYYLSEDQLNYIRIGVDRKLGLVREIAISNAPDSLLDSYGTEGNKDSTAMFMHEELPKDDAEPINEPSENNLPEEN